MSDIGYPFRDLLDAMKEKDAALFAQHSHRSLSDFWREWKAVYPEDFPHGGGSEASSRSIVPKALEGKK
jgi:hypothetical protein